MLTGSKVLPTGSKAAPAGESPPFLGLQVVLSLVAILLALLMPPRKGISAAPDAAAPIPVALSSFVDNRAVGQKFGDADFDGAGNAYPAAALPALDVLSLDGVPYLLTSGPADNVVALGQTIPLTPGRYCLAYLLVAASYGEVAGTVMVHYADGSTTSSPLDGPDWNRGPEAPSIVASYRYTPTGKQYRVAGIYEEQVWFDPARVATSLTLPTTRLPAVHTPSLHLFALTLQPAVVGPDIKVVGGRSTTKTMPDGSQVVAATVINIGSTWYTPSSPATLRVDGSGITTSTPGSITDLGPGEETSVEIGIRPATSMAPGTIVPASIVAATANGTSDTQTSQLTMGVAKYQATIASLQQHEAPDWYDEAKFGIFIHYGLYSIPAWAPAGGVYAEWYWHSMEQKGSPTYQHQLKTYGPNFTYDDFIPRFTARNFNPHAWVELFKQAGARYFVFVTKHHDGFALFRTAHSHRDSVDLGPHKDLVQLLFQADRRYTPQIHPGVYYSLPEWYNPAYGGTRHKKANFPGGPPHQYVTGRVIPYAGYVPVRNYVEDLQVPQMMELINQYHPDILWCDIGGPNDSLKVIAQYYNDALNGPDRRQVAVDNRCGVGVHDFTTPEYRTYPTVVRAKWETSRGIDPHSYGYNANTPSAAYATARQLIAELVDVVSKNGNFLLDIGPRADGSIPDIMQQRLRQIGAWLRVNGEAIYDTVPWWRTPDEGNLRFTIHPNQAFYITCLTPPGTQVVVHNPIPIQAGDTITLLGWHGPPLTWNKASGNLIITVPPAAEKSGSNAWTFKIMWNGGTPPS